MKELYGALFEAHKEIKAITKDEKNPFFGSKYFDINKIIGTIKPVLEKHGLVIMQPLTHIDGKPAIKTIVAHSATGQFLESETPLPTVTEKTSQTNATTGKTTETQGTNAQSMGSTITYYRRYALQSLLLLESKEDDDGNTAAKPFNQTASKQQTNQSTEDFL